MRHGLTPERRRGTGLRDGCGLMPGHDVARHVASVGRGLPSQVTDGGGMDWLSCHSIGCGRGGTGKQVKGREEGRRWEEKCARWWRLVATDVGRCQARVIGLGVAAQAEPDASATGEGAESMWSKGQFTL